MESHIVCKESKSNPVAAVINDDATQRKILSSLLRKKGRMTVHEFDGGEAALEDLSAELQPDLIVVDLYMPGIDGWRLCRLLRSKEYKRFNDTPILVVSATFSGEEPASITAGVGANAFLPQPIDPAQFLKTAEALLRGDLLPSQPRVLIVEDDEPQAFALRKCFEQNGYEAKIASDGRSARDAFAADTWQLVILDYHLPDVTADILLEQFRRERPECAVVMITGDANPDLAAKWMKAGASAYVKKPFEPSYLIELSGRSCRERALLRAEELLEERTQEVRQREAFNAALFDYNPVETIAVDSQGRILQWNRACEKARNRSPRKGDRMYVDYAGCHEKNMREELMLCLSDGKSRFFPELRYDNQVLSVIIAPFPPETPAGAVITTEDMTSRMQLEQRLRQAQKMEAVGQLAGGIAHDFNNMLMGVMGYLDLCREDLEIDHPVRQWLDDIERQCRGSAEMVRRLLGFARKQMITPRLVNLNTIISGMIEMLRRLLGENISLVWQPAANLGPVRIDPRQIDQLLANLCVNARDAIEGAGQITISTANVNLDEAFCATHPGAQPGKYVAISVADNGRGMSEETLKHIYEPFFTTKQVGDGSGLGLATVYGIVKQNKGYIDARSQLGAGATFTIHLPRCRNQQATTSGESAADQTPKGTESILLVEDEDAIRHSLGRFLGMLGYTVRTAATGEEALDIAAQQANPPDLLISDVVLPGIDGRETADRLAERHPGLKCLFMSGYTYDTIAPRGILDEGVAFLQKPFSWKELGVKIRDVLDHA